MIRDNKHIIPQYGSRKVEFRTTFQDSVAVTLVGEFNTLYLFATPYRHLKCGLVSPGRDTSRSRTHFQRDLRSHESFFVSFFIGKKKKGSLYPELKVKFADLEERYNILGAKINRFIKYVEQNG
jgi:hypothetical protein